MPVEAATPRTVRLGIIGLGNRGTTLLRTALDLPGVEVTALCDTEPKHVLRGLGIAEKARGTRPEGVECAETLLERKDLDAVVVALPCDLHSAVYRDVLRAGKALYAEKPLALTLDECDSLIAEADSAPQALVHVGFQRRSNPRYREGVALVRRGELERLLELRATWVSSNGPVNGHRGWLASRERSGDWMVEQAVHVWDLLRWITGELPVRAYGHGRRDVFAALQPDRDVTDHYTVMLEWPGGFHATLVHSWVDPADDAFTGVTQRLIGTGGGIDFGSGAVTFRDKSRPRHVLAPGHPADTRLAVEAFVDAVRADTPPEPPVSLHEARDATLIGLLVRKAVDEGRPVALDEVRTAT
jgi:predicted dehydrogenase